MCYILNRFEHVWGEAEYGQRRGSVYGLGPGSGNCKETAVNKIIDRKTRLKTLPSAFSFQVVQIQQKMSNFPNQINLSHTTQTSFVKSCEI